MKIKGQFRGHCQVCGRVHVVEDSNNLAKHGYRVAGFGYFAGTCSGAGELPLEHERIICDAIILDLNRKAHNEVLAAALRAGGLTPHKAQKLETWGSRVWQWVGEGRDKARTPVMIEWSYASDAERKMQVEQDAGEAESFARFARGHAKSMQELADKVHGTKLIDRDQEELERKAAHKAKREPIEGAYRSKAEQQRELERLNRAYSELRERMIEAGVTYLDIPFDLHNFNQKRLSTLMKHYAGTDAKNLFLEAAGLYAARELIKSRPVIK